MLSPGNPDLIVSAVSGYGWPQLRAYAVSLSRIGFTGRKVMFIHNVTTEAVSNLTKHGFHLIHFTPRTDPTRRKQPLAYCNARYAPVIEFLKEHSFRNVIWTDTRDLIFQSDPFVWLRDKQGLYAAGECWTIKGLPPSPNDSWVKYVASPSDYAWLREQEALCSGTIAGDSATVLSVMEQMFKIALTTDQIWGIDQGIYNCVAYKNFFNRGLQIPLMKEGFIATCSAFKTASFASGVATLELLIDKQPRFDRATATVYAPDTEVPFCIVHQYDRDDVWKALIETKYAD